jgi:hypothetical protein
MTPNRPTHPTTTWPTDELTRIGDAEELDIASRRTDGSLRPYVTIWVVRAGDDVYVRSAYGYDNPWFQRALHSGEGRIRAGGVERDVRFEALESGGGPEVDRAYHAKYDHYGPRMVRTVASPDAVRSTLRVLPA